MNHRKKQSHIPDPGSIVNRLVFVLSGKRPTVTALTVKVGQ